jgi:hypothetical protein
MNNFLKSLDFLKLSEAELYDDNYDWFPPNPEDLSDLDVLKFATADIFIGSLWLKRMGYKRVARLSKNKAIQRAAKRIALREFMKLADGVEIDSELRKLAMMWARQQLRAGRRGRPGKHPQMVAVQDAYSDLRARYPGRKRLSLVADLCARFKLSRSQIEKIIGLPSIDP